MGPGNERSRGLIRASTHITATKGILRGLRRTRRERGSARLAFPFAVPTGNQFAWGLAARDGCGGNYRGLTTQLCATRLDVWPEK
jgi:hypothetical protein